MKLVELLVQAGYDYNKGNNSYKSPSSGRWLKGGEALMEFYKVSFPGFGARVETKGEVFEDPFAVLTIKDQGHRVELTRDVKEEEHQSSLFDGSESR